MPTIAPEIFKAYDIRGIVDRTLTTEAAELIGRAFGTEALAAGTPRVAIGRDGRLSGPKLAEALAAGLRAAGCDVVDVGMVPTPVLYFAAHHLGTRSGIMVTGSHNPPEYNGLKMVMADQAIAGAAIQGLRTRIEAGDFASGQGAYATADVRADYLSRIVGDVKLSRPIDLIVDCGNGVAGELAPQLYRAMGCRVTEMFCDIDGNFPNHHPDPSQPENLEDLIEADGDRLGVVTKSGRIIFPDRQLMLFAEDVLTRNPGAEIIFDVKCTRQLFPWITSRGGKPLMWKTGHSLIKAKLRETGAPLAGEMSGHVFFKERWYGFDDGLYAGARLLEILSRQANVSTPLESLPDSVNTPELQIKLREGENYAVIDKLQKQARFPGSKEIITIDGVRVEYPDGFGLARSSNTTPVIVLRFEADNAQALARIQDAFRQEILAVAPEARLPY
jgi:phosphomannomutase/phosphoglucomutase